VSANPQDLANFGGVLLMIGMADLAAAGVSGTTTRGRCVVGVLTAALSAPFVAWILGVPYVVTIPSVPVTAAVVATSITLGYAAVSQSKLPHGLGWILTLRPFAAFAQVGLIFLAIFLTRDWIAGSNSPLSHLVGEFSILRGASPAKALVIFGAAVYLASSGSSLVRLVFSVAGTTATKTQVETAHNGRLIGIIERWFILGFVLSGNTDTAGFVIAAKALLRFPELSKDPSAAAAEGRTEYVLLGSLVSWFIAFAVALVSIRA